MTSMIKKQHYFIAISITIIFLFITFLFLGSRINFTENEKFISELRRLQTTDAILNQYLLRLRSGTLATVDPLNAELKNLQTFHNLLYHVPSFIMQSERDLIVKQLDELKLSFSEKEKLIERFKAENATLQTSMIYFPVVTQEIINKFSAQNGTQQVFTTRLQTLLRDVLLYGLNLNDPLASEIAKQTEWLEIAKDQYELRTDKSYLEDIITQVKSILAKKPSVDNLLNELVHSSTIEQMEKISNDYNYYYSYVLQKASFYRLSLYIVCILLLIYIAWLIIQHLENRVQEATFQIKQYAKDLKDTLERERHLSIEKEKMGAYIPKQLVDEISRNREKKLALGGKTIKATILFSDIKGFTKLSESLDPQEVVSFLNIYMTAMTEVIEAQDGLIDKFIGDGIMAVFTDQMSIESHALRAVKAGVKMQEKLIILQSQWITAHPLLSKLKMRVGINTGIVVAGNIGSQTRMDYTVVGDNVNVASRIESICEPGMVFISASTYEAINNQLKISAKQMPAIQVKNRHQPVHVYAINVIGV